MTFAHWSQRVVDLLHSSEAANVTLGPVTFVVDIPAETDRKQVATQYAAMLVHGGNRLDPATDQAGFEEEWPPEVRTHFQSGGGTRVSWSSLA